MKPVRPTDRGELVRVRHFYIGDGPARLKVGIADDGTLLFLLPPTQGDEEVIISLERDNAIRILSELVALLERTGKHPDSQREQSHPPRPDSRGEQRTEDQTDSPEAHALLERIAKRLRE